MTDGWDVAEGDPWSVSFGPNEFTRVVRLRVGDFTIALSALSAHKLGSALHAASGIDTTDMGEPLMCRWCHRPIAILSAEQLPINESAWVHVEPQPGTGWRNQIQCEPDMQSMAADPDAQATRNGPGPNTEPGTVRDENADPRLDG